VYADRDDGTHLLPILHSEIARKISLTISRSVRIMVTLPTEAAATRSWAHQMIKAGIDCVRINCAHDEPDTWIKMVRNVRAAADACGRSCKILMDLTGPRVRTADVLTPAEHSRVQLQDRILLTRGKPAADPNVHFQARCSLPDVFAELKSKRLVYVNEGRIGAQVVRITPEDAELRVVAARPRGEKFRSDMALNFPGTDLHIPSLTEKDLTDLDFIVRHADLVGYSFVQRPEDLSVLLGELDARRARFGRKTKLGIVAKIETAKAVRGLPEIIVRAAGRGPFGVMIARGDLAVEVGYLASQNCRRKSSGSAKQRIFPSSGRHKCSRILQRKECRPARRSPMRPWPRARSV
jgi:pyruvate kinase